MFCTSCGAKLEDGARFCTSCGTPLAMDTAGNPDAASEVKTVPQPAAQDAVQDTAQGATEDAAQGDVSTMLVDATFGDDATPGDSAAPGGDATPGGQSDETTVIGADPAADSVAGANAADATVAVAPTSDPTSVSPAPVTPASTFASTPGSAPDPASPAGVAQDGYMPPFPEKRVDMSHAFEPETQPVASMGQTTPMPVIQSSSQSVPVSYSAVPEEIAGTSPAKKKRTGLIVGIICAVLVLAACGVAAAVYVVPTLNASQTYTVNFETGGGSTIDAAEVEAGQSINTPVDPTRSGYSFGGWYLDAACNQAVSFPFEPDSDVTIYAKWTALSSGSTSTSGVDDGDNTASTDEEALAMLKGYFAELQEADDIVHDYAEDSFNKSYNKGASKVSSSLTACDKARNQVEDLLYDSSTYRWKVSSMTIPQSYNDIRSDLEEASDTLEVRLTAYRSALKAIQGMNNPSDTAIDAAIKSYLNTGHEAYEKYKSLEEDLEKDLG